MKHVLIFGLIGPTIGFLMALGTALALGITPSDWAVLSIVFAHAFAAGIVPAVLTGLVDLYLAPKTDFVRRALLTSGTGYLFCALVGLTLLNRRLSIEAILIFALFGAIPKGAA